MAIIIDGVPSAKIDSKNFNTFDLADTGRVETEIKEGTELGDSLKELNRDDIEPGTRMSGIDMRARLHYVEVGSILAIDTMVLLKFLPVSCSQLTRQKKRLSVSIEGQGRNDIVNIVSGKKEMEAKTQGSSLGERLRGLFGSGGQSQVKDT